MHKFPRLHSYKFLFIFVMFVAFPQQFSTPLFAQTPLNSNNGKVKLYDQYLDHNVQMDSSQFEFPSYVINDKRIDEASGISASRTFKKHFWTHNDSGDSARFFLINDKGRFVAQYHLPKVIVRDVEDISAGKWSEKKGEKVKNYIFLADMGDNKAQYESSKIYVIPEPTAFSKKDEENAIKSYKIIEFSFEDGKRDAETLLFDHITKDMYVVSKREKNVNVYKIAYPQSTEKINIAKKVATLPFTLAVAGDITLDGKHIIIKNYANIYYWKRDPKKPFEKAFDQKPKRVPYIYEPQGEAVTWSVDGNAYYTLSEEVGEFKPMLNRFVKKKK